VFAEHPHTRHRRSVVTVFLGVDGGGTKTAICLVTEKGHVASQVLAPSTDYFTEGVDLVARVLCDGVAVACAQADITPDHIHHAFFGLATYGEVSRDIAVLDAAPRQALGHDRYACGNDMVCGWAGSLGGADGINVVSGTGSITYGENRGRTARAGGWGELFGDEGSAYWVAARGLNAFTRMADGRLTPGPLLDVLREHLDLRSDLDVVDIVLNRWRGRRDEIAALSRVVADAAERGDEQSRQVLAEAGQELAGIVEAVRGRLGFADDDAVPVSYSGGVFGSKAVVDAFRAGLADRPGSYELRRPLYPPDVGGAVYAAKLAGTPLEADALRRLQLSADTTEGDMS
jgi:N-acetylglucosamine kinase-like BadF-type ATPase